MYGADNLHTYTTSKGPGGQFCKTCGIHILGPDVDREGSVKVTPLNLRAVHGVKLEELNVTRRYEGASSSRSGAD